METASTEYVSDPEKLGSNHEHLESHHDDAVGAQFDADENSLPPGYFRSSFFLGTMTAIGLGLMAGVAGFGYAAPILSIINDDIGPVKLTLSNQHRFYLTLKRIPM